MYNESWPLLNQKLRGRLGGALICDLWRNLNRFIHHGALNSSGTMWSPPPNLCSLCNAWRKDARERAKSCATAGTFWVVTLKVSGDDSGGGINTPPMVRALCYASATPVGAYNPPSERKILVGVERRRRRMELEQRPGR